MNNNDMQAKPGDVCPQCGGVLTVYCTKRIGQFRKRFLACRRRSDRAGGCGYRPEQNINVTVLGST
jgi:hypothetical protein